MTDSGTGQSRLEVDHRRPDQMGRCPQCGSEGEGTGVTSLVVHRDRQTHHREQWRCSWCGRAWWEVFEHMGAVMESRK